MSKRTKIPIHPFRAWRLLQERRLRPVAIAAGISKSYLSLIERRKRIPPVDVAMRLCQLTRGVVCIEDFAP